MTSTTDNEDLAGPGWAEPDRLEDPTSAGPVFDGDTGTTGINIRRTLVSLLKKRYISAEQHPTDWKILAENEDLIRSRLHELFVDLVIDRTYHVAYKRQAVPEGGTQPFPTLLHDQAYTREETILLVKLRMLLRGNTIGGAVFVDRQDLIDDVASYRPPDATNHSRDEKAAKSAVENLERLGLLQKTAEPDRFRISPVVEVLMSVSHLTELLDWLADNRTNDTTDPDETDNAAADMAAR
ncbi:Uncharacterised protein [Mycobacteroides abscessus subsp. abscessus]|uniref:DUF4194 domain-containing protein n=1 Tax=Mycobacteroides abscessus TaxID=36809 RepID=UPI00092A6CDE|nr:DUF4194 domain-containing protein [Mycobacteroides abscessus]SHY07415.1 Uncharacterised protein [Mycobacteroides abscessus subsp. abscessus]SIC74857.1 Uncharacterised protein [Mycobacteroides abscessus subsp. abscessus]SKP28776.1 Uncharacterised protein [Mycobacteroides abscessus subsp. abscessus]